jgi:hypothetical protein
MLARSQRSRAAVIAEADNKNRALVDKRIFRDGIKSRAVTIDLGLKSVFAQVPWLSPTPGLSIRIVAKPDFSISRQKIAPNPSVSPSGYSTESQLSQPTKKIAGTLPLAAFGLVTKIRIF